MLHLSSSLCLLFLEQIIRLSLLIPCGPIFTGRHSYKRTTPLWIYKKLVCGIFPKMHVILPTRWSMIRRQTAQIVYTTSLHFWWFARFSQMQLHLNWPLWINSWTFSGFSRLATPELMKFLLSEQSFPARTFICSVQMSVLYKTHLDATIHWCNLPAHFWRTNYCALVKQTIWNASPLNYTCRGIQASSLHAAFVLLLLALSHICLLSGLKAN